MIQVTWSTPGVMEREERIAAQCEVARQAAGRHQWSDQVRPAYQQDQQHGGAMPVAEPARQPKPILMSADNPDGRKLEDLLHQVRLELQAKNAKLIGGGFGIDASSAKRMHVRGRVRENNELILALLAQALQLQNSTTTLLATLGPDQGPRGQPRV